MQFPNGIFHYKNGHSSAWAVSLFVFHRVDCKEGFPVNGRFNNENPIFIIMCGMSAGRFWIQVWQNLSSVLIEDWQAKQSHQSWGKNR